MYRIEISGGIATGKTTLARRLSKFAGLNLFEEPFRKIPFWKESYEEAGRKYTFQKNTGFIVFHAKCIIEAMIFAAFGLRLRVFPRLGIL